MGQVGLALKDANTQSWRRVEGPKQARRMEALGVKRGHQLSKDTESLVISETGCAAEAKTGLETRHRNSDFADGQSRISLQLPT